MMPGPRPEHPAWGSPGLDTAREPLPCLDFPSLYCHSAGAAASLQSVPPFCGDAKDHRPGERLPCERHGVGEHSVAVRGRFGRVRQAGRCIHSQSACLLPCRVQEGPGHLCHQPRCPAGAGGEATPGLHSCCPAWTEEVALGRRPRCPHTQLSISLVFKWLLGHTAALPSEHAGTFLCIQDKGPQALSLILYNMFLPGTWPSSRGQSSYQPAQLRLTVTLAGIKHSQVHCTLSCPCPPRTWWGCPLQDASGWMPCRTVSA